MRNVKSFGRLLVVASVLPLLAAGCSRTKVWAERTESFDVPANASTLQVRTHNGAVSVQGEANRGDISVVAKVRGGGATRESAEESLAAIEVISESRDEGIYHLGWRWTTRRHSDWGAEVSFKIQAPEQIACDVKTHNGGVVVERIAGPCKLETHNGKVVADGINGELDVLTHNGGINAKVAASNVSLETHNGGISLDASECAALGGNIVTHNGGVRIKVGTGTSADLVAETHNGSVKCSATLAGMTSSRSKVQGRLGEGGPTLVAKTHNGGVRIE